MTITVKLVGSGKPNDPFRVPLPTYAITSFDTGAMTATVEIPDQDAPPAPGATPGWAAHLGQRYGVPATTYTPQEI